MPDIIPIGINCYIASYLDKHGLRTKAYPFDWLYADRNLIYREIKGDFKTLLDRSMHIDCGTYNRTSNNTVKQSDHSLYLHVSGDEKMFNHHDITNDEIYEYFVRSAERFRESLKSPEEKLFILCDFASHRDWIRRHQDRDLYSFRIFKLLEEKTTNFRFVDINAYYNHKDENPKIVEQLSSYTLNENHTFYNFNTVSKCAGTYFLDERDDECFNNFFKSLIS